MQTETYNDTPCDSCGMCCTLLGYQGAPVTCKSDLTLHPIELCGSTGYQLKCNLNCSKKKKKNPFLLYSHESMTVSCTFYYETR